MTVSKKPKILLIDIETLPGKAYIWNLFDDHVPLERLIDPGRIACAAFKWHGEKGIEFVAEWQEGGRGLMLMKIRQALNEADAVVTYNGDHFDFSVLRAEFLVEGMSPPAPITSIDLYKTIKTMRFMSRKLEYIAPLLKIGKKVKHEGFKLWKLVMEGDEKARLRMERYNKQDVRLLGTGYDRLKPFIVNHPHLHEAGPYACPVCGSKDARHEGHRYTATMKIERLQCKNPSCGKWYTGKRSKKT